MQTLDQVSLKAEFQLILKTLIDTGFDKKKTAEILGIDRKTLYQKLKKINLDPDVKQSVQIVMS